MKPLFLAASLWARVDDLQEIKRQLARAERDVQQREAAIKDLMRRVQALEQQRKPASKPSASAAFFSPTAETPPVPQEAASKEACAPARRDSCRLMKSRPSKLLIAC